ncbi:MAG: hemerythrin domain-containing protein [Deltaproteobacteria bacterium]|nr:MAG: hemerythrin domain-containing protein [Deltaproteobacteria bacterium]
MHDRERREVLVAGAGLLLVPWPALAAGKKPKKEELEVSPGEDLMREHGVLNRVLLIYEEISRRLDAGQDPHIEVLAAAGELIRRFIEGYHEKLEETELFPRFEKAGKLVDLVSVLRQQHAAGRAVTEEILKLAAPRTMGSAADRARLAGSLRGFVRMYRPHEAREDTVLFPAFHELVGQKEYERMGRQFEDREHELLGEAGFEKAVAEVARLEESLGIFDLAKFTPQ